MTSNMGEVLLLEGINKDAVSLFEQRGFKVTHLTHTLQEEELKERIKSVSVLGVRSKTRVPEEVLESAKNLVAIGAFCIGTDKIHIKQCNNKGVIVFNAPFSNTRSVVELALGATIMLMRRVPEFSSKLKAGIWTKSSVGCHEIRGKTLGIIGYGNTGSQLSVLAEAVGMDVLFFDIVEKLTLGNAKRARSMEELLSNSDIVSLHIDGRNFNKELIGHKQFEMMKDGAIFVNLSRAACVDEKALVENLITGKLRGAAIDVYSNEPKTNNEEFKSKLVSLPNVLATPHLGGSTVEAQQNIADFVAHKLIDYLETGSSSLSVNFPQIQLPTLNRGHRLLHVHKNVPGILAQINGILANQHINIESQYLKTNEEIGYVITDTNRPCDIHLSTALRSIPETITFRTLS